ncbi:MAG TPA: SMP-30/gluconolactonase/LRE family protein [Acidimicrobiales bacterium]|nr:SMP-30/gluconolactonase/LRE family protein [Acidimicrobiales bacterium]
MVEGDVAVSRWQRYFPGQVPTVERGWQWTELVAPSRLFGANGMTEDGRGRLLVTQAFGSQVTAIDLVSGRHEVLARPSMGVMGPDDGICAQDGSFFATEPFSNAVRRLDRDNVWRTVRDDVFGANGITMDHRRQRLFVDEFREGGRLLELDAFGSGPPRVLLDGLNGPNALAMGPDGRLYLPLVFAGEVWCYDLDEGRGWRFAGDLQHPTAVKFDQSGRLVVTEAKTGHVTAIDIATGRRTTIAAIDPSIDNVSIGAGDRLYVSHFDSGLVTEIAGDRRRVLSPAGLLGPQGVAVQTDGSVLVADGLSILVVRPDGAVVKLARALVDQPGLVCGIAPAGEGFVLLSFPMGVVGWQPGGAPRVLDAAARLDRPSGLVADGTDDRYLVCDRDAGTVVSVGLDATMHVMASALSDPVAVARDSNGSLWVSQARGAAVVAITADGSTRTCAGIDKAEGLAANDGMVLVADVGARRLIAIDPGTAAATTVVEDAPIGPPDGGQVPFSFCSVAAHPRGGFVVGCNGDGSIRWLRRAATRG